LLGQSPEHDADHGEADEGGGGSRVALEIAGEAPVVADPGKGALYDPAFGQDDEAMQLVAFDDFELPGSGLGDLGGGLLSLITGIGKDAFDEREQTSGASIEHQLGTVAILDVGGMDDDIQQETERVDENMPFAARNLLARIEALRVERGAPFWAALALWLSMIAAVGLASRPSCLRVAT
jgi:hypothetical protein